MLFTHLDPVSPPLTPRNFTTLVGVNFVEFMDEMLGFCHASLRPFELNLFAH